MSTDLVLINLSDNILQPDGVGGTNIQPKTTTLMPPHAGQAIATFTGGLNDWDWAYVADTTNGQRYQLFIGSFLTDLGLHTTGFGYYDPNADLSHPMRFEFPSNTMDTVWTGGPIAYYTLRSDPPVPPPT